MSSRKWRVLFLNENLEDPVLHGLKALNGTLHNWTVRGGSVDPGVWNWLQLDGVGHGWPSLLYGRTQLYAQAGAFRSF